MSMRPTQVNTNFLNNLPPEWSKFVTDVKLARDLHTTNYDHLYSYLEQHEARANETRLTRERYQDSLAFVANYNLSPSQLNNYHSQYNSTQFPQQTNTMIPQVHSPQSYSPMYLPPHLSQLQISHSSIPPSQQHQSHSGLTVLVFNDPIACLNKAMAFLTVVASSRLLGNKFMGGKDKVMLVLDIRVMLLVLREIMQGDNQGWLNVIIVKESGQILDVEQLAFLADPDIQDGQAVQKIIPKTDAFQTEDLDAYDSDCDDVSNAKVVLMANLSNYGSDVISKGEYAQWRERFMNYLKEQTDGEAMINSIQNGDQPLHVIAQVSLVGTAHNAPPTLKDPKKAAILYEYETFKAIEGEKLLDTYLRYLQYATLMRQTKNLMDINIDDLYNILKQNQGDVNDALGYKKKAVVVHSDLLALVAEKTNATNEKRKLLFLRILKEVVQMISSANKKQEFVKTDNKKVEKKDNEKKRDMSRVKRYSCKKEGHFAKDCKKVKVKDYESYKTKML
nr:hypothetical protein [Tanacetum cinerariifolium]